MRAEYKFCPHTTIDYLLASRRSSAGIDELLLTREERVALRANFNLDLSALGRSGYDLGSASAGNRALFVRGMQSLFHVFHLR